MSLITSICQSLISSTTSQIIWAHGGKPLSISSVIYLTSAHFSFTDNNCCNSFPLVFDLLPFHCPCTVDSAVPCALTVQLTDVNTSASKSLNANSHFLHYSAAFALLLCTIKLIKVVCRCDVKLSHRTTTIYVNLIKY